MSSLHALSTYRSLLRSIHVAFRGDARMLTAAHAEARQKFEQGKSLDPGSSDVAEAIEHARSVAKILRQNVVQGIREDNGDQNHFRLRIHEDIERGDNETLVEETQKLNEKLRQGLKSGS